MVRELSENGREAASRMYGCRGWVLHHNTDLWRMMVRWTVLIVGHGLWLMHGFVSIYGTVICFPVIRSIWRKCIR